MTNNNMEKEIGEVLEGIHKSFNDKLFAMSQEEIASEWYWNWEEDKSIEWNTYKFTDILELHKSRWRRWEEHHNGSCMVVERVRDKYVMPRVKEFLAELAKHQNGESE